MMAIFSIGAFGVTMFHVLSLSPKMKVPKKPLSHFQLHVTSVPKTSPIFNGHTGLICFTMSIIMVQVFIVIPLLPEGTLLSTIWELWGVVHCSIEAIMWKSEC